MDCIYCKTTDIIADEEGKKYTVYGIKAVSAVNHQEVLKFVPDIFFDQKRAEEFIAQCNALELKLIHLMDVIEDELS